MIQSPETARFALSCNLHSPPWRATRGGKALALIVFSALAITSCKAPDRLVAVAGIEELTAQRLAELFVKRRNLPLQPDLVEQFAHWWVEYQLFAQRTAAGDSLLDSATVVEAMWPDARKYVVERFRAQLLSSVLPLDSASIDSAYRAGNHRLIQHILIQVDSVTPAPVRARRRHQIEELRKALERGTSWDVVNRANEDLAARERRGIVGIMSRGQTLPSLEEAIFALQPGAVSQVLESPVGFHIVRRPPLEEVRAEFHEAIEETIAQRLDSLYFGELARQRRLRMKPDAIRLAREVVSDPLRFKNSHTAIATFDGGRFTAGDLVRRLQTIPDWTHRALERGSDSQLIAFVEAMVHYELMYLEAREKNTGLSPRELATLRQELAERLEELKSVLGVYPPSPADPRPRSHRLALAAQQVNRFFFGDWDNFERVPVFLAEKLKRKGKWTIHRRGIERTIRLAAQLRARSQSP